MPRALLERAAKTRTNIRLKREPAPPPPPLPRRHVVCFATCLENGEPMFTTWTHAWSKDPQITSRATMVALGEAMRGPARPGVLRVWHRFSMIETTPEVAETYGALLQRADRIRLRHPMPANGVRIQTLDMTA